MVLGSQDRVARAARSLIAVSPASHWPGGQVPGTDAALAASRQRQAEAAEPLTPQATQSVEVA
jgi:hypothetical protein